MIPDQDELQEYECLVLEGVPEDEARQLARHANAINQSHKIGPYAYHHRDHKGKPIYRRTVTFAEYYDYVMLDSVTMDRRTDDQIEADFAKREQALDLLKHCTKVQRDVIERRYGLNGHKPMTYRQIADDLGYAHEAAARDRELDGLKRIRRTLLGDAGLTEDELAKRNAKRQRQREWMRRKREMSKLSS